MKGDIEMALKLSVTSIREYLLCPAKYYFDHIAEGIEKKTDLPRLCGIDVHNFVKHLYNDRRGDRKFFYKTLDSARGAWFSKWNKSLIENRDKLIHLDPVKAKKLGGSGWVCIENYWKGNINTSDPVEMEKYKRIYYQGIWLVGKPDQIRSIPLKSIEKFRPEIIENGVLSNLYNPEVTVDLKTGFGDYDTESLTSNALKIRTQYSLQRDLQAAAYTLIYQKYHSGKLPAGFILYQLKYNKKYPVRGDDAESQNILKEAIEHVLGNIRNESYPKYPGNHCKYCDYVEACIGNSDFHISIPGNVEYSEPIIKREKSAKLEPKQLRLKFKNKPPAK